MSESAIRKERNREYQRNYRKSAASKAYLAAYEATDKRKASRAAAQVTYCASDKGKATKAAYAAAYNASEEVRKRKYLNSFNICNPTQEQWEHYRDATKCECCGVEFGHGSSRTGKAQDHDHKTNKLRGVICQSCNTAEGHCKTPERAYEVACYMASNLSLKELIGGLL